MNCIREGIRIMEQEESYTSKADITAMDFIPVYGRENGNVLTTVRTEIPGNFLTTVRTEIPGKIVLHECLCCDKLKSAV